MGSSASSISDHSHGSEVTSQLQVKLDEYRTAGMSDEEIQIKLRSDYEDIVSKLQAIQDVPIKRRPSQDSESTHGNRRNSKDKINMVVIERRPSRDLSEQKGSLQSRLSSKGQVPKSGKHSTARRRSFDNHKSQVSPSAIAITKAPDDSATHGMESGAVQEGLVAATTEEQLVEQPNNQPVVDSTQVAVDSWDSVTQQPFCPICHMTFKSIPFLERHIKYSDLHLKAVQKLNPVPTENLEVNVPAVVEESQVEGIHYKLLYTGSKLFWRTQETIDFDIFHHLALTTIEIIAHNSFKGGEVNRLYLDYAAVSRIVEHLRSLNPDADAGDEISQEEKTRNAISRYLLQRLQMDSDTHCIKFTLLSSDGHFKTPEYEMKPEHIRPVTLVKRRKTNGEDFEVEMQALHGPATASQESI
jgi:hypothetical protein